MSLEWNLTLGCGGSTLRGGDLHKFSQQIQVHAGIFIARSRSLKRWFRNNTTKVTITTAPNRRLVVEAKAATEKHICPPERKI